MQTSLTRRRRLAGTTAALSACGASFVAATSSTPHSTLSDATRGLLVGIPLGISLLMLLMIKRGCAPTP